MIILATNVLSELMKPTPAAEVVDWLAAHPAASLYTTSITQAEILHGLMLLPRGRRRSALEAAATSMFAEDFGGRILGFGTDAAPRYAQIAAIARWAGAAIATRNLSDFEGCGVTLVDPWRS